MALTQLQQLHQLVESSGHILVVFHAANNVDSISSALALKMFFEKQNKQVDVVANNYAPLKSIQFLTNAEQIKPAISHLQKFIIKVDVSKAKIDTLSYDVKDNWLSIYLTPKQGIISKNELRAAQSTFKYDLIFTVNVPDLETLKDVFFNNADLFYKIPVVNFDHHAGNEHFGQINFVELNATSTSEIIFNIFEQLGEAFIDQKIATALLTGMICETRSFRTPNVTPHTLGMASKLMNKGADREKIVQHLYRTRSLSALKLWGQALSHLQIDNKYGLVWTTLTRENFTRSGANEEELKELVDELIVNAPEAKIILLLYETDPTAEHRRVAGNLTVVDPNYNALTLLSPFQPDGNKKTANFAMDNKTLKEAEEKILGYIRETIAKI